MAQAKLKEKRIHLRLNESAKEKIERAAALRGTTVTEFVISTAMSTADQVIAEQERIVLYDRDRDAFLDAVVNPPAPKKALSSAMSHYQKLNRSPRRRKK